MVRRKQDVGKTKWVSIGFFAHWDFLFTPEWFLTHLFTCQRHSRHTTPDTHLEILEELLELEKTAALLITNKTELLIVGYCSDVISPHPVIFQEFLLHHIWPLLRKVGPRGLGLTAGPFHRRPCVALRVICGPLLSALSLGPAFSNYRNSVSYYRNTVVQLLYAFP